MNSEELKGKWKQLKGSAQSKWAELSDDEIDQVEGDRKQLVGKIQEKYGRTKEEVEQEVDAWMSKAS